MLVELTPKGLKLIEDAISAINSRCSEFCIGECDCFDRGRILMKLFNIRQDEECCRWENDISDYGSICGPK